MPQYFQLIDICMTNMILIKKFKNNNVYINIFYYMEDSLIR